MNVPYLDQRRPALGKGPGLKLVNEWDMLTGMRLHALWPTDDQGYPRTYVPLSVLGFVGDDGRESQVS